MVTVPPESDAALIAHTLELAAQKHDDIFPEDYARFFANCPASVPMFKVVDPSQPPHGCGQMLFEILSLLQDVAADKPYVASYMQQIASDHRAFGVGDPALYKKFLDSMVEVLAGLLGADWTVPHARAWERQSLALVKFLPGAEVQGT